MSQTDKNGDPHEVKEGEVLPAEKKIPSEQGNQPTIFAEIAAQIHQYTDRPDLLLEVIEKHDPGFIKEMNRRAKTQSTRQNEVRYKFGERQAYTSLSIAVVAGIAILGALIFAIAIGKANFWTIIALALFYAITQGGELGFDRIISGIENLIKRLRGKKEDLE